MAEGNRADGFDSDCNSDKDSFLEYVESMIRFRRSHDDIEVINSLRFDGAALVESMPPMQASRIVTMIETGGSSPLTPSNQSFYFEDRYKNYLT